MNLKDLSLQITEEEYRELPEINYSLLSTFNNKSILAITEKQEETSSLLLGSLVDFMLTSDSSWRDKYIVLDSNIPLRAVNTIKMIKEGFDLEYSVVQNYPSNWKPETSINKYNSEIGNFVLEDDKIIVPEDLFNKAADIVKKIQEHSLACLYFGNSQLEMYHQLKFKAVIDNIGYKCMIDAIHVDSLHKCITPIDLKTTSKHIWQFPESFIYYNYWIQANLYTDILKENLKGTEYENYTINPYRFVVANSLENEPCIVYQFISGKTPQGLKVKYNKTYKELAEEINPYLYEEKVVLPREFRNLIVELDEFLSYDYVK